jgi:hypothetical protein
MRTQETARLAALSIRFPAFQYAYGQRIAPLRPFGPPLADYNPPMVSMDLQHL